MRKTSRRVRRHTKRTVWWLDAAQIIMASWELWGAAVIDFVLLIVKAIGLLSWPQALTCMTCVTALGIIANYYVRGHHPEAIDEAIEPPVSAKPEVRLPPIVDQLLARLDTEYPPIEATQFQQSADSKWTELIRMTSQLEFIGLDAMFGCFGLYAGEGAIDSISPREIQSHADNIRRTADRQRAEQSDKWSLEIFHFSILMSRLEHCADHLSSWSRKCKRSPPMRARGGPPVDFDFSLYLKIVKDVFEILPGNGKPYVDVSNSSAEAAGRQFAEVEHWCHLQRLNG